MHLTKQMDISGIQMDLLIQYPYRYNSGKKKKITSLLAHSSICSKPTLQSSYTNLASNCLNSHCIPTTN